MSILRNNWMKWFRVILCLMQYSRRYCCIMLKGECIFILVIIIWVWINLHRSRCGWNSASKDKSTTINIETQLISKQTLTANNSTMVNEKFIYLNSVENNYFAECKVTGGIHVETQNWITIWDERLLNFKECLNRCLRYTLSHLKVRFWLRRKNVVDETHAIFIHQFLHAVTFCIFAFRETQPGRAIAVREYRQTENYHLKEAPKAYKFGLFQSPSLTVFKDCSNSNNYYNHLFIYLLLRFISNVHAKL